MLSAFSVSYPDIFIRVLNCRILASLKRELQEYQNVEYFFWASIFGTNLSTSEVVLLSDQSGNPKAKNLTE